MRQKQSQLDMLFYGVKVSLAGSDGLVFIGSWRVTPKEVSTIIVIITIINRT